MSIIKFDELNGETNMKSQTTVLLIHGLWVTPRSWENFRRYFEGAGCRVLAPAWPGMSSDVAGMRRDPSGLHGIGIAEVVAHYSKIIDGLPEPPIIMGHSYGGLITQLLIDRGLGVAGVAIDSVPPKGILVLPLSTYGALTPSLINPRTFKRTFMFTFKQWWRVFANTLSEADAKAAYEEQVIPASGRAIFQAALANLTPRSLATINFANPKRPPLLFIAGEKDVIMPAALNRKNFKKHQASSAVTEYKEFPGRSHYIIAEKGWQEVAEFALKWALSHAGESSSVQNKVSPVYGSATPVRST
jgi:pimeloyl-ACP methyl ester carboxylesterase